ncbi:MAG TPA: preprotein translocase subunit SecA [Patescibacteria group bacterium]|nr:preprotein translocase subunit SecA [Patescibacteria group bacterium]
MSNLLSFFLGDPNKKVIDALQHDVEKINGLEPSIQILSDEGLRSKTAEFRERIKNGEAVDDLLYEAFAVAREAAKRQLGQRYFDVQLMGGIVLHRGSIAEMRTGEGKTLTATAPLYLNALEGKGCHLVTVNDYLARRDAVWMGQIYHALGLTVSSVQHDAAFLYDPSYKHEAGTTEEGQHDEERDETGSFRVHQDYLRPISRKEAYAADITYGTNNEFGFDYLRDNMKYALDDLAQRPLHYAIVDEVDSILIDEARTPLIISAPAEESNELYYRFAQIVRTLLEKDDYTMDEKMHGVALTEQGIAKIEKALGVDNLYAGGIAMAHHAEQALRAQALYRLDRDYVVKDGQVIIVDEFTGRLMHGRRYSEGLHQAIEAKENVEIQRESETLATITFQNYFRMYKKLAGMTGTAATEAEEFAKIYKLEVTTIPTHRPNRRTDRPDRIYKSQAGKFLAVAREVKRLHAAGQPVLLGTVSIEKNELLSELLKREGVPHEVLNAKNHEREAEIVAQAGRPGAVTLATNMAGRGVDIVLGGNPPDSEKTEKVRANGGLFVIGTERHESRRIDNQLRGRSGRQGDPGATQFYLSLEDDLMRIFGSDRVKRMMEVLRIPEDEPIEHKMVSSSIEKAQHRVEGHHFDVRKHLLEYDDVLNKHRELIYGRRREVLEAFADPAPDALKPKILELVEDVIEQTVLFHTNEEDGNVKEIVETASSLIPMDETGKQILSSLVFAWTKDKQRLATERTKIIEAVMERARETYARMEEALGDRLSFKRLERDVVLRAMDRLWIEHLQAIDQLRTGIGLRGYGQLDPLVEYKRESFQLFNHLLGSINEEIAMNFFKVAQHAVQMRQVTLAGKSLLDRLGVTLQGATKTADARPVPTTNSLPRPKGMEELSATPVSVVQGSPSQEKVGRNDPCPCGSGKKYKKCHGG